jgi:bifunctional non-homologous end joining protein LigD
MSRTQIEGAEESITLYFREGSSDKVYSVELLCRSGLGWVVLFAYGRRGSTMNTGEKTAGPVPYEKAKKVYDKLVAEKTAKGYTPGEDGTPYTAPSSSTAAPADSGVRVQLLNEVAEEDIETLIADDAWGMQEKMDGRRQVVQRAVSVVTGINRKGLAVAVAGSIHSSVIDLGTRLTIDGEAVGDTLYAFDLLEKDDRDLRGKTYTERHAHLVNLLLNHTGAIVLVPLALGTARKRKLFNAVKNGGGEGVVFKRLAAPYTAGRPNSGGDQLKFKFYSTGSFIVSKLNAKRSVGLKLADGTAMGNVTIPPNKDIPPIGAVVEIRYLYCFAGGSLYQPTYLVERDDIGAEDCTARQIKFKATDYEEDA